MPLREDDIEKKVILLKLLLRESDETLKETLNALVETKMATLEHLKELLQQLQEEGYVTSEGNLTLLGEVEAKKAKQEFTL